MWLCRRLGIVKVFNGHRRGQHANSRINDFHLYHWKKPDLRVRACDFRDGDANASGYDPALGQCVGEAWEYLGNIFEMLPYAALAGEA